LNPVVSIACISYNHANYIRDCLDGFLRQETNFPFEIVIHDDASTDETQDIIREYAQRYPDLFFPLLQTENQYSKLGGGIIVRFNYPRCRGRYIAICEGDDYWTDKYKLQKQFDFMEAHPEFNLCGHKAWKADDAGNHIALMGNFDKDVFEFDDVAVRYRPIPTSSIFFRNNLDFPEWYYRVYGGDRACIYLNAQKGKIKIMDFIGSTYRVHAGGLEQRFKKEKFSLPIRNIKEDQVYYSISKIQKHRRRLAKRILKSHFYLLYWAFRKKEWNRFFKTFSSLGSFILSGKSGAIQ
jgi:glycosyltransferase involved in cell wall biosynthesis